MVGIADQAGRVRQQVLRRRASCLWDWHHGQRRVSWLVVVPATVAQGRARGDRAPQARFEGDHVAGALGPIRSSGAIPAATSDGTQPALTGSGSADARLRGEHRRLVGPLPGQVEVEPAEVAVRRGLAVDRPAQVERRDDRRRSQVEVALDERQDLARRGCARCRTSRSRARAAARCRCAYATSISNRSASPAATTFLATQRAA